MVTWAERARRRRQQRFQRVDMPGPDWQMVKIQPGAPDFLAIGPGGLFLVTVVYQGRNTARLTGDLLVIHGRRRNIGYLRDRAQVVSATLSRRAGVEIPVDPVLALSGAGVLNVYGGPLGVTVTPRRQLPETLNGYGERLAPVTVDKLYTLVTGRRPGAVRLRPPAPVSAEDASRLKELRPNPLLLTAAALLPAEHRADYVEWWQSTITDEAVRTPWQRCRLTVSLLHGAPAQAASLWRARRQVPDRR
jgi:hypothetical protein